jgi:hypothetical protein
MLTAPIGAGAVEVQEDVPGFSAFVGADDAAVFEFVHDPGGAGVTESEPALEEGDTGLLFAADDLDALLNEVFVFVGAVVVVVRGSCPGELLVDLDLVARVCPGAR